VAREVHRLPRCYRERVGSLKRLFVIAFAACAAVAATPHRADAGPCGIPDKGTVWIDFADGSVPFWQEFARPGVIAAAANFIYPPQLRAMGAKTIYWDMNLPRRVGTPLEPFDPAVVIDRANRIYDTATMSTGCTQPMIAENELNGANTVTPWSATNAGYRRNVLIYVQTLAARGARPVLLVPSTPFIGDTAGDWWREVAKYADIVRESYFAAPQIAKQGPVIGSRALRAFFRKRVAEFTAAGISTRRLGLMLGFQTTPGSGGREHASRRAWLEVTKLQTLAARQVAKELDLRSVWSWGWGVWSVGENDPDKPAAACVYLWARNPSLCDGQAVAGPSFNASRTEGQLVFPRGARCTLYRHQVTNAAIAGLESVTGNSDVAFTAAFARVVASLYAPLKPDRIRIAEKAAVARLGGYAHYRAALAKAHAGPAAARGVIGDELRRAEIEGRLRVDRPSAADVKEYYATYAQTEARLVQTKAKTPAPWLGGHTRGLVLASNAPPQLFTIPEGRWLTVRTMLGAYRVRALEPTVPLGAVPFGAARPAVVDALKALSRDQLYETWLLSRERSFVDQMLCRKDVQPEVGIVPLTDYLPFLAAQ
jgi:hypothetical protein